MKYSDIYAELGYEGLLASRADIPSLYPEYSDIIKLGADKVYFSGDHPTVLFLEVGAFNDVALKKVAQIQHNAWNYRRVLLLFAVAETEVRVYNCHERPKHVNGQQPIEPQLKDIELLRQNTTRSDLGLLAELFSRIGVDCGLLWTLPSALEIRKKIRVQRRVDKFLADTMKQAATKLKATGLDDNIVHGLLMRSLFILFLEDKGAAKEAGLYDGIKERANSYFDVLGDREATYKLFDEVKKHFNGNVFPVCPNEADVVTEEHLKLIRNCFFDGNLSGNPALFDDWRLFNFEIIQVELLSEIYENFLGEMQKERGQHYTPLSLVEFMLNDKLPATKTQYNVKILDPACGSGIFLVEGYKRLVKRWKKAHPDREKIEFDELKQLLTDNIFGIEIDPTAIRVAAFSLYLALIDELDPKKLWIQTNYQLPYLIRSSEDTRGQNLWCCDTILLDVKEFVTVDLVVGNPPFGTDNLIDSIKQYCTRNKFAQEQVLPFIHKSVAFCPDGDIALVFNAKVLTNTQKPYQNFRKWLFGNYVEKVYNLSIFRKAPQDFGGQLFSSAVGPVSIVYFRKAAKSEVSETIEYWAPKTFVKSNLVEGVVIDSSDVKFLPRAECQRPGTKIWKIAMWGGMQDFRLISRLQKNTLRNVIGAKGSKWIFGKGFNSDSNHPDLHPQAVIRTESIERYYTNPATAIKPNDKWFRKNKPNLFVPPFILFKEGQHNTEIASSLFEEAYGCETGASAINNTEASLELKKLLVAYFNSAIVNYYLFLYASSWGIERERILLTEVLDAPNILECELTDGTINSVVDYFDKIIHEKNSALENPEHISAYEEAINDILCTCLHMSERDKVLMRDMLTYQVDLLKNGTNSIALHRTLEDENKAYATTLCGEINHFLRTSSTRVQATVFDVQLRDPLNLIVLRFGASEADVETQNVEALRGALKVIDEHTLQERSQSIYVKKQVRYYKDDTIYLIKPNQKRFWTRSQAMEDAVSLISDIMNMHGE